MDKCIVYIGDFDFRNENVQAHLVKNNGTILNSLGYHVEYIGINRNENSFKAISRFPLLQLDNGNRYYELPETLNIKGLFKTLEICRVIINRLNELQKQYEISHIITYQSPTYSIAIKKIAKWCQKNRVCYIVNCADLPTFELQSPLRKLVMKTNWNYMHKVNHKYADGIIAVSKYIEEFYRRQGRPSVIIPPLFNCTEQPLHIESNEIPTFIYAGTPFKITGHAADPKGMKDRLDKIIDLFLMLSEQGANFILNIVGISKEDYILGVPRHKEALINEKKICFLGRQSHRETLVMVANSDFSVNYRDENLMTKAGFSTKIVESVSLGTPVIINDISDTFDYLEEGVSGFKLLGIDSEDTQTIMNLCELSASKRVRLKETVYGSMLFDTSKYESNMSVFLESLSK